VTLVLCATFLCVAVWRENAVLSPSALITGAVLGKTASDIARIDDEVSHDMADNEVLLNHYQRTFSKRLGNSGSGQGATDRGAKHCNCDCSGSPQFAAKTGQMLAQVGDNVFFGPCSSCPCMVSNTIEGQVGQLSKEMASLKDFEGAVESKEKENIPVDIVIRQGPKGAPGAPGPQGFKGPDGEAGPRGYKVNAPAREPARDHCPIPLSVFLVSCADVVLRRSRVLNLNRRYLRRVRPASKATRGLGARKAQRASRATTAVRVTLAIREIVATPDRLDRLEARAPKESGGEKERLAMPVVTAMKGRLVQPATPVPWENPAYPVLRDLRDPGGTKGTRVKTATAGRRESSATQV
jgi:hypothetical protein